VVEPEASLKHLPFFEEIASTPAESAANVAATAGLVTLRLVDTWIGEFIVPGVRDDWALRSVRTAIEAIEETSPSRAILSRIVDMVESRNGRFRSAVTPLMAYAKALEYDAKWALAADVYETVLAHLHPVDDADASIAAHLRLGQCFRTLNDIESSAAAYETAFTLATAVGDVVGVLRARIGEGRIAMFRGNLPHAEAIFDETISRAVGPEFGDVRSSALHGRANVAHFREQYELAIQFAYQALEHAQIPAERDRILGDIAVSFLELGVYSAARDAYLVISATAQEQYTRWAATLNLLEIAALTGMQPMFELYRRQLVGLELPPYMATAFEMNLGTGYQRFGDVGSARLHLERAAIMAGEHGFNQFVFDAEEALEQLDAVTPPRRTRTSIPLDVQEVAQAIKGLRETAGV
jgi:tetratricopeptide (TPR) repeat protein